MLWSTYTSKWDCVGHVSDINTFARHKVLKITYWPTWSNKLLKEHRSSFNMRKYYANKPQVLSKHGEISHTCITWGIGFNIHLFFSIYLLDYNLWFELLDFFSFLLPTKHVISICLYTIYKHMHSYIVVSLYSTFLGFFLFLM